MGIGLSSIIASLFAQNSTQWIAFISVGSLSSMAPDADLLLRPLSDRIHRGVLTHSLASSLMIGFLFILIMKSFELIDIEIFQSSQYLEIFLVSFICAYSHVILDTLDKKGTLLFWPISKRRIRGSIEYDNFLVNNLISLLGLALLAYSIFAQ